jgi:hypothetical protein
MNCNYECKNYNRILQKKYGIKSLKTFYNRINKGVIEKVEDESGNIFVIEKIKKMIVM